MLSRNYRLIALLVTAGTLSMNVLLSLLFRQLPDDPYHLAERVGIYCHVANVIGVFGHIGILSVWSTLLQLLIYPLASLTSPYDIS
jgi:hypothetical protein